jgi:hypothetical protein
MELIALFFIFLIPYKQGVSSTEMNETALLLHLITTVNTTIKDDQFISSQKAIETPFSRDRLLTFEVPISFLMTNLQKGLHAVFSQTKKSGITSPSFSKISYFTTGFAAD